VRKSTRRRKIVWAREMRVGWSLPEIPGRDWHRFRRKLNRKKIKTGTVERVL
jgi:hypothetical protein